MISSFRSVISCVRRRFFYFSRLTSSFQALTLSIEGLFFDSGPLIFNNQGTRMGVGLVAFAFGDEREASLPAPGVVVEIFPARDALDAEAEHLEDLAVDAD